MTHICEDCGPLNVHFEFNSILWSEYFSDLEHRSPLNDISFYRDLSGRVLRPLTSHLRSMASQERGGRREEAKISCLTFLSTMIIKARSIGSTSQGAHY